MFFFPRRPSLFHSYQIQSKVNSVKKPSLRLHGLIQVNLEKLKKIFEISIFHMKKLKNNSCEYRLYMYK